MTHDPSRMMTEPVRRLALSVEESGQAVGLCGKTVAKLISEGRLRCVRVGTRRLVPVSELQRWLDTESGRLADDEVRP